MNKDGLIKRIMDTIILLGIISIVCFILTFAYGQGEESDNNMSYAPAEITWKWSETPKAIGYMVFLSLDDDLPFTPWEFVEDNSFVMKNPMVGMNVSIKHAPIFTMSYASARVFTGLDLPPNWVPHEENPTYDKFKQLFCGGNHER